MRLRAGEGCCWMSEARRGECIKGLRGTEGQGAKQMENSFVDIVIG